MIRRPPRSTQSRSSAASDVYKRQLYYKESSGICRWDFFDWGKQMETVMRTAHPNSVVMMMGTNDTQSVWDDGCLLYTSDAADDLLCVDLGGRRIIKKK